MWFEVGNIDKIPSPALLLFPDRIQANIDKMIAIAGNVERLRPHIKTHKLPQVVDMQMQKGIRKFKCATIAEAEMLALQKAPDILLAMQPVGPQIDRLLMLTQKYPESSFSCLTDSQEIAYELAEKASNLSIIMPVWIDINNGMNRTGIAPGDEAFSLFTFIQNLESLSFAGLHVYDGHVRNPNFAERKKICDNDFEKVVPLIKKIKATGLTPKIIAGGTPTFPIHCERKDVDLSPGTVLLWDQGYGKLFQEMDFLHAAVLLTRIISKPGPGLLCLDLGHKAIASEMLAPRLEFLNLDDATMISHSEEHMVVRTAAADNCHVGDCIYGIPTHICPTVDRQETVFIVENHQVTEEWPVVSRKRKITV